MNEGKADDDIVLTAKVGTQIFSGFLVITGVTSYFMAIPFGRRCLLLTGLWGMSISLLAIGLLI